MQMHGFIQRWYIAASFPIQADGYFLTNASFDLCEQSLHRSVRQSLHQFRSQSFD
jgi:hypothetical protein